MLDRVNGPLADALTGRSGSLRILHELEDANAFVTAVDVGRSWFRYHRLFADLLRLELRRVDPALVGSLHRAAARWFELTGDAVEAIRHAQAAGDWDHATRLLADHQLGLTLDGRGDEVRALLAAFPPHAADTDAELALTVATALLARRAVRGDRRASRRRRAPRGDGPRRPAARVRPDAGRDHAAAGVRPRGRRCGAGRVCARSKPR